MIAIAYYLLKVLIGSGILFTYYHLALRNKQFHQWNRFYLLLAVLTSLLLPCVHLIIRHQAGGSKAIHLLQVINGADEYMMQAANNKSYMAVDQWPYWLYAAIAVVLLMGLLTSATKIYNLLKRNPAKRLGNIIFVDTDEKNTPFSFLHFVFWNKKIDIHSSTGQMIFKHELVHVQEAHTLDKLFMQLVLILFWYNPFFWLIRKELVMIHEFIADKKSMNHRDTDALAAMMLQVIYPQYYQQITNSFFQSSIKRRITMLTKNQTPRFRYLSRILALCLLLFVGFAFTVKTKTVSNNPSSTLNKPVTVVIDAGHGGSDTTIPKQYYHGKEISAVDVQSNSQKLVLTYIDGSKETLTIKEAEKNHLIAPPPPPPALPTAPPPPPVVTPPPPPPAKPSVSLSNGKEKFEGIYILNGKPYEGNINDIHANTIESMNVLKGQAAIDKYGDKGKKGVIEIVTKEQAP